MQQQNIGASSFFFFVIVLSEISNSHYQWYGPYRYEYHSLWSIDHKLWTITAILSILCSTSFNGIELLMQYLKSILCYCWAVESRIDCQEQSQRNSECIECCLKIDLQLDYISSSRIPVFEFSFSNILQIWFTRKINNSGYKLALSN